MSDPFEDFLRQRGLPQWGKDDPRALQVRARGKAQQRDRTDRTDRKITPPACPVCGGSMVLRTAQKGAKAGSRFWGCAGYPACKGTRPVAG
ncbi:MAG: topoisomerase DNA-binding C4 zinc finger domain-containing protein [candidate division NC10 bacterium]|nr:topoisomerase DNA-binding C4 zinc finger domain-containing protein [candidate division NC10 bacterium]